MRHIVILFLGWSLLSAETPFHECVGDHHEGCPVLVSKEQRTQDPGCHGPQEISHGTAQFLIRGTLVMQSASDQQPARKFTVMRECLDEIGGVVRGCPMPFRLDRAGRFNQEVWRKSVGEAICRDDVLVTREYEEKVQLRFQAKGCQDLVVPMVWPWDDRTLVMDCRETK